MMVFNEAPLVLMQACSPQKRRTSQSTNGNQSTHEEGSTQAESASSAHTAAMDESVDTGSELSKDF